MTRVELAALLALLAQEPADKAATLEVGPAVVAFAREQLGKSVGRGECSELVVAALEAAGVEPPRRGGDDPVWGERVEKRSQLRPGDVIQFRDVVFLGRRRAGGGIEFYRTEFPHHTAIVEKVLDNGRRLVILHQNAGRADADESARRVVRRDTLMMRDLRPGGTLTFYRPRAAKADEGDVADEAR